MEKTTDNNEQHKGSNNKTKRRHGVGPSLRVDDDADNEKDGGFIAIPGLENPTAPPQSSSPCSQALVPSFGPPASSYMPAATTTAVSLHQERQLAQVDSTSSAEEQAIIAAQERAWELAKSGTSSRPAPTSSFGNENHQKSKKSDDIEMGCNPRPQRQPRPYLFEEEQDEDTSESDDEDRYPGAVRVGGANDNNNIDDGDDLHTMAESTTVSTRTPVIITAQVVDEDAEDTERDQARRNMERMEQLEEEVRRFRERERNIAIATATATAAASSAPPAEEVGQLRERNTTTTTSAPVGEQGGERTKGGDESQRQQSTDGNKRSKYATAIALCLCAIIIIIAVTVTIGMQGGGNDIESPGTGADTAISSPTAVVAVTPTENPTSFPTSSPANSSTFTRPNPEECKAIATRDAPTDNNDLVAYSFAAEIDAYATFFYNPGDEIFNQMLLESLQREVAPFLAGCEKTPNRRRDLEDENEDELSSKIINVEFENVADRGKSCEEVDNDVGSCISLVVDFTVFVDGEKEIEASHMVAPFQHGITNVIVDGVTRIRFVGLDVIFEAPSPTKEPELWPTTESPTNTPTITATDKPTDTPGFPPTAMPTTGITPSENPLPSSATMMPTTVTPSATPTTGYPSSAPSTVYPSTAPSTSTPSATPTTGYPSSAPSTVYPSTAPSTPTPSQGPTMTRSDPPSSSPTGLPSLDPTMLPSLDPTTQPTTEPSSAPSTNYPSTAPSTPTPSQGPTMTRSDPPSSSPTGLPSLDPTMLPSLDPTTQPTTEPSSAPSTNYPSTAPSTPT